MRKDKSPTALVSSGRTIKVGTPLEELYFEWLLSPLDKRGDVRLNERMLVTMHKTPFKYFISNDQNRALDGRALREEFLVRCPVKSSRWEIDGWLSYECSVLEMMLALDQRAYYQFGDEPTDWFVIMVDNLGLLDNPQRVKSTLSRLNNRQYSYDGTGGLFPLRNPREDQRDVEIWYQMSAYMIENNEWEGV